MPFEFQPFAAVAILTVFLFIVLFKGRNKNPLPPGPKGYPVIGTLGGLGYDPRDWAKFKTLYGPLSSITTFGRHLIIINDLQVAINLLDKKSTVYSNRPTQVFSGEMIGWNNNVTMLQPHDERFRTTRKYMSQVIGSKVAVKKFDSIVELETRRFLTLIPDQPQHLKHQIVQWAGAIILSIAYGYDVKRDGVDPILQKIDRVTREHAQASQPGAWLVDSLPLLRHLPDWFPGAAFKKKARQYRASLIETIENPFQFVKRQMEADIAPESFTSRLLRNNLSFEEEAVVKWSAHSFYAAGSDTTSSTLHAFFLAMVHYPDVQKKAQAELDSIVGSGRLPCLADRESLPYTNAVMKEVLRWTKAVALGLPHVAAADGVYNGYLIPKGSVLISNIWLFNHDPENFPDPMSFKPERFLDTEDGPASHLDPIDITFGFGRRICPGRVFASSTVFMAIAMTLASYNISKAKDKNGVDIIPPLQWTIDGISHPVEFECEITARSEKTRMLVESVHEEYPLPPSHVELVL